MNMTQISTQTQEELIKTAHSIVAVPSLIILFVSLSLIFLVTGLILIDKNKSGYTKFMWIWMTSNLFGLIVLLFLIYSPFAVQGIRDFFVNLVK